MCAPRPSSAPRRGEQRRGADVVAAAPVAGDRAERRKAKLPAVRGDADAVDPGAADDGDAPPALRARTQQRDRVVPDDDVARDPALLESDAQALLLGREVHSRQEDLRNGRLGAPVPARRTEGLVEEPLQEADRLGEAEVVGRGERAADVGEQRAVRLDEREVGLRVAAVHGQDGPVAHRATPASGSGSSARRVVEKRPRELVLADERMREERLPRGDRVTRHRRLGGEPLVGSDVLHEPEKLGRERALRQRRGARPADARRELDDVVVLKALDDPVVSYVDDLDIAAVGGERGDQRGRGLAVERAAALLEERRLLGDLRVAVDVEEPGFDLCHRGRAGHAFALLGEYGVVGVEVPQVRGRDRAELLEQPQRERGVLRERVPVALEQLGEDVALVDERRAAPTSGG